MAGAFKVAMVAALEREVRPLTKDWRVSEREYQGRRFRFFENENVVVLGGGVGPEAARQATEAVIALYGVEAVQSVGFAGALDPALKVGDILTPGRVIDSADGSSIQVNGGRGVLVSTSSVAGKEQKAKLAKAYGAQAVDMEARSVARGAEAHGIGFSAIKVISDEADFEMPGLDRFVRSHGQFGAGEFLMFAAVRPWLWGSVLRLARNSAKASRALCRELEQNHERDKLQNTEAELHPIARLRT